MFGEKSVFQEFMASTDRTEGILKGPGHHLCKEVSSHMLIYLLFREKRVE